jgi:hypothetical protein
VSSVEEGYMSAGVTLTEQPGKRCREQVEMNSEPPGTWRMIGGWALGVCDRDSGIYEQETESTY